jgi:hypothetical protein
VNNAPEVTIKPVFTERPVWHTVGNGWRHLHGSVSRVGVSFEWHDFTVSEELNWGRSFHPGSIEVCLNREGNGRVAFDNREIVFTPMSIGFYRRGEDTLRATRQANQLHRFLTVETVFRFLAPPFKRIRQFIASAGARGGFGSIREVGNRAHNPANEPPATVAGKSACRACPGHRTNGLVSGKGPGIGLGTVF